MFQEPFLVCNIRTGIPLFADARRQLFRFDPCMCGMVQHMHQFLWRLIFLTVPAIKENPEQVRKVSGG